MTTTRVLVLIAALAGACSPPATSPECTPGAAGCACQTGNICAEGLSCEAAKCAKPVACLPDDLSCKCAGGKCLQLKVGAGVRACDVVLDTGARKVASVTYDARVRGQHVTQDAKLAVSFVAREDKAFTNGAVGLTFADGANTKDAIASSEVHCFDRQGAPVADPGVSFQ